MIFKLADMIGSDDCATEISVERKGTIYSARVRAVPLPFYDGFFARVRASWDVLCGRAYPVKWPEAGELERALGSGR